jgi:hypothetical protein
MLSYSWSGLEFESEPKCGKEGNSMPIPIPTPNGIIKRINFKITNNKENI